MKAPISNAETNLEVAKQAAHDIRAPLTALQFFAAEMHGGSEHQELLKTIIGRINNIANDLLRASKGEAAPSPAAVVSKNDLAEAVDKLCQEKELELRRQGLSLRFDWNCRDVFKLHIDKAGLVRVLSNLINNSVDAGATQISLKVRASANGLGFAVVDNGCGFDQPSPKKKESHGLGLHGARNFARAHSSRLTVSRVAGTTRVGFKIPSSLVG